MSAICCCDNKARLTGPLLGGMFKNIGILKMVIWKYELEIESRQVVMMPAGAEILSVQQQDDKLQMWAIVEPEAAKERRRFEVVGTGNTMPDLSSEGLARLHLATVQTCSGLLVWHVFELL